jgi:hypothetical protein
MDFWRKILVVLVILLTSYILYRLYKKRQKLLSGDLSEGFSLFSTPQSELGKMQPYAIPQTVIMNMNSDPSYNTPLNTMNQYIIKSAYNCACSGQFFSTDAIDYVLRRGCRWLDFEVFYDVLDDDIYVSKSEDDKKFAFNIYNAITLRDALSEVISFGTASSSPNNMDPLFVQIRPKILEKNANAYPLIANTIVAAFGNKLHGRFNNVGTYRPTPIDPSTQKLQPLNRKIVIVLDTTYVKDIANCPLNNYANMVVGSADIPKKSYSAKIKNAYIPYDIDFTTDTTTIKTFQEVVADSNSGGNISFYNMVFYYGVQITPAMFYYNDTELYNYEVLFENQRTAFCPIALANKYIKTTSPYNKNSS